MLLGHDESVPDRDTGAGENRGGRRVLRGQSKGRLLAAEHGSGGRLFGGWGEFPSVLGPVAGRSREGTAEAGRIVPG